MTSPLSPGDFLLYNETVRSVLPNGSISIIKFILSQQIVSVYSNGTALVNFTIYVLNGSYYYAIDDIGLVINPMLAEGQVI
ncbi:hypothetical protein DJ524_08880, partial [Sulfolobus sp. D5]